MPHSRFHDRIDSASGDALWLALLEYADYLETTGGWAVADGIRWLVEHERIPKDYSDAGVNTHDFICFRGISSASPTWASELPESEFGECGESEFVRYFCPDDSTKSAAYIAAAEAFAEQQETNRATP